MGFALPEDFRQRYVRIDAAWWVPRLEELKKMIQSSVAAVRSDAQ
jgi:hypothetical protein